MPLSSMSPEGSAHRCARAHRDGLLRGLAVLGVLAALICLGLLSNALHSAPQTTSALPTGRQSTVG